MIRPELGSGPLTADVWAIGRDYGAEENRAQRPFVGQAGRVLDAALRAAGVERADVRVDNLVPKQPRGNDFAAHPAADLAWGQERLRAFLLAYRPKLVVALGNEVGRFLLGEAWPEGEGIQDLRGYLWGVPWSAFDSGGGRETERKGSLAMTSPHGALRVLTTVHPAAVLRDWTPWRALLDLDLRRAVLEARAGCPSLDQRDVTIVTSPHDLRELDDAVATGFSVGSQRGNGVSGAAQAQRRRVERSQNRHDGSGMYGVPRTIHSGANGCEWLAVDIENTHDLKLACVGFAPTPSRAWVIPAHEAWQLAAIRRLCESSVPKVLQNGQYDRYFLRRFAGVDLRAQAFDTMLAWHSLQPELAGKKTQTRKRAAGRRSVKSLKFLASIYTRDAWFKDYNFTSDDERYVLCGKDCCVTLDIALKQAKQLEAT